MLAVAVMWSQLLVDKLLCTLDLLCVRSHRQSEEEPVESSFSFPERSLRLSVMNNRFQVTQLRRFRIRLVLEWMFLQESLDLPSVGLACCLSEPLSKMDLPVFKTIIYDHFVIIIFFLFYCKSIHSIVNAAQQFHITGDVLTSQPIAFFTALDQFTVCHRQPIYCCYELCNLLFQFVNHFPGL